MLNADRWDAGKELMQASSPAQWNRLADDWNLIDGNKVNAKAVAACEMAAAKAGKAEDCRIVVPAPRH